MKTVRSVFPKALILAAALALSACSAPSSSAPASSQEASSPPASEAPSSLPAREPTEEYTYLLGVRTGPSGSAGIRLSDQVNQEEYRQLLPLLESLSPGEAGDLGEYPLTLWVYSSHAYPLAYHLPARWEGETVPVCCQPAEGVEEASWYEADGEFLALLDQVLPALPAGADSPAPTENQDAAWVRQVDNQRSVERTVSDAETLARIQSCLEGATPLDGPPDPLPEGTPIILTLRRNGHSSIYGFLDWGEQGCLVQNYQTSDLAESCSLTDRAVLDYLASLLA